MIIKCFVCIISLFFMFLANGCFRNQDAARSARLEIQIKEYDNLLKQEQSKKQSLESEIYSLRNNNNYGQKNQEINRLESELRNSKNNESILTSQINNLQAQLNTARSNDSSKKLQELSNELSNLKNNESNLNSTINSLQTKLTSARSLDTNLKVQDLSNELKNSKNNESILNSQINNLQTQLNTARGNDNSQKVKELNNELEILKIEKNQNNSDLQTVKREKEAIKLELTTLTNKKNEKITYLKAQIDTLNSQINNLKSISSIKDLTDSTKAPDLSQANLDDQAAEEIAKTIVSKNLNDIKKILASSKAPEKVKEAVKKQLKEKGYDNYQINDILNPKITIQDKNITIIDDQAKDQLILQLENASEQEKLAFQTTLVSQIKKNNLTNKETLDVFYKVVDLNNQKDELFNNPKLMPAVKKLMQANPDKQMDFISKAKDSNKIVELLTNADALGIAKEVIVGDKYELTNIINDDFSLLEYADWDKNPGIIEAYRKKFTDDEWQERLLKKFNYRRNQQLDKVSQELSAHNFDVRTMNNLREEFKITAQAGDFNDKIKDVIESNAIDIETNIKKSALFLNEQGLKNMAEYMVNNLSIFAEKDQFYLYEMKKIIPFLDKYLDNKDQDKLTDFKNKLETISIYNIFAEDFKDLNDGNKTELIRQISTANDEEKNNFFDVLTEDISNFNTNLIEVMDKLLESGVINKDKSKNIFNNIINNTIKFTKEKDDIRDKLIETFLRYNVSIPDRYLSTLNRYITSLADNLIKNAHSKDDYVKIYNKYGNLEHEKYVMNYLYQNKDKKEQLEALKELLKELHNKQIINIIYTNDTVQYIDLIKNAKTIGLDIKSFEKYLIIADKDIIKAYKNNLSDEEWKNFILLSTEDYNKLWSNDFTADEIKEKQELLGITENLLGGFNDSYKNLLNLEDNDGKKTINTLKKIALFLKDKKDFTDMAEYIVSKDFNEKLVEKFSSYNNKKMISFLEQYLKDKSKLNDLVDNLTKHKNNDAYKTIIDDYKNSALLTEEQKKKLE